MGWSIQRERDGPVDVLRSAGIFREPDCIAAKPIAPTSIVQNTSSVMCSPDVRSSVSSTSATGSLITHPNLQFALRGSTETTWSRWMGSMVSSLLTFPPGYWTLWKTPDRFGLPRMRLIASAISQLLHAFFTSRQSAWNAGSATSVTRTNPSATRSTARLLRFTPLVPSLRHEAGWEAGATDLLIPLCRDGEAQWPSFGFAGQQQVIEAPAKGRGLNLELSPDTSDPGLLLTGKCLHQLPHSYLVFEIETGTACLRQARWSVLPVAG